MSVEVSGGRQGIADDPATAKTPEKSTGWGHPEALTGARAAYRDYCYLRQFPGIIDRKTGKPLEYKIDKPMALYILDGSGKKERLAASNREKPCVSYTGQSRVWKEPKDSRVFA